MKVLPLYKIYVLNLILTVSNCNGFVISTKVSLISSTSPRGIRTKLYDVSSSTAVIDDDNIDQSKQGLMSSVFSLVKCNVGSGVFALPAGISAFSDVANLNTVLPAALVMSLCGLLAGYTFYMIPRISRLGQSDLNLQCKTKTLAASWENEVGKDSAWFVSLCLLLTPLGTVLTYSIILGDIVSSYIRAAGVTGFMGSRQVAILTLTYGLLYPLTKLQSLSALAPVSIIGVLGVALTSIFMVMRALPHSPYFTAGSVLLESLPIASRPSFGVKGNHFFSPSIFILISMAACSMLAHCSSQDFCDDLKNNTANRFKVLVGLGFGFTVLANIVVMTAGFLTFGGACKGMILNNYSPLDIGATISRLLVAVSLIGSFPIYARAIKSAYLEFVYKGQQVSDETSKMVNRLIVGCITATSLLVSDAGIVISLLGAIMGSAIIYQLPSIIFLKKTRRLMQEGKLSMSNRLYVERIVNKCLIGIGGLLAILGTMVTLKFI